MNKEQLLTPIAAFYQHAKAEPKRVVFRQPINGDLIEYSFADALFEIQCMASRLLELPPKSKIGIISLNCAHWVMADLAIMLAGHISVPIYPSAGTTTVAQILEHSGCRLIFVGKMPDWETKNYLIPGIIQTISMHHEHQGMESWSGVTSRYSVAESYPEVDLDEMSSIIYTSGTTGLPKGVMTSFRCMAEAGAIVSNWVKLNSDDRFFSYLPLAHAAERVVVEMAGIYCGGVISFVGSMETFNDDLVASRATVFLGVPRIWIKFQQAIEAKLSPNLLKVLLNIPLLSRIVKNKLLKGLGLANVKIAISGAAALPFETLKWFEKIGLPICEGYGMTESFGVANFNHPDHRRPGSVGKSLPDFEMKIAEDGEILYKNNCLMMGYYLEPELTDQTMCDGFLCTGDTGNVDEDGYLWITGRVKDIFKTSKGKYISPIKIEMELEPRANLDQICVMGSNLSQPVVLGAIAVKPEKSELDNFEAKLERIMKELNRRLEKSEKIMKWFLVEEVWSADNDMITPTLKMRRQAIEKKYMPQIEQSLASDKTIIWLET